MSTNIFHKCVSNQSAVLKNNVVDREVIRIDIYRYDRSFLKFVVKVPTNSATKFEA